jgi:ribonuclease R
LKKKPNKRDSRKHGKPARGFARNSIATASRPDARKPPARSDQVDRQVDRSAHRGGKAAGQRDGSLSLNARGFGFVVSDGEEQDVFIPPDALGGAMHGDRVRVRVETSPKGLSGRVLEVLGRAIQYVSGQIHVTQAGAWLDPDDERMRMAVRVQGDLPEGARTGQGALAKIVRYPEHARDSMAVEVLEVFEPEAFVEHEIRRVLLKEGVQEEFPLDVRDEAAKIPVEVERADYEGREDLRHIPLMTIDPADARDHDDAVWAERLPQGGFRVIVAIADVSHYVREGTALDREALERGCTIYLPTRAIPMLPRELSSNLASLLPEVDRLTLAVEVALNAEGEIQSHRFIEGVMRSVADISYEKVAFALGLITEGPADPLAQRYLPELKVLLEVSAVLREVRRRRGSLELELPEPKVRVDDETGRPTDVERSRKDPGVARAYNLIEELMLLGNEVVARDLAERMVPAIYRVHGRPDPDRIETFCALAQSLGYPLDADSATKPKELAAFLRRIHGTPQAGTLGYLMLRAMKQAVYSVNNEGHFGLAADHYLHFTSPIRRYPDMAVHRVVRAVARGERVGTGSLAEKLQAQAEQSSLRERRAMGIEREVVDLYGAFLMRDRIGETFDATVSGVTEHGFYASLDAPFVDTLCRVAWLPPDVYELDQYGVRLTGQHGGLTFGLGDRVRLEIKDVSIAQRKVLAAPAGLPVPAPKEGERPVGGFGRERRRNRNENREQERVLGRKKRKERMLQTSTSTPSTPPGRAKAGKGKPKGRRR